MFEISYIESYLHVSMQISGSVLIKASKLLLEILRNTRLQALVSKNPPWRLPSVLSPIG